jgi:hypothetical protein
MTLVNYGMLPKNLLTSGLKQITGNLDQSTNTHPKGGKNALKGGVEPLDALTHLAQQPVVI